MILVSVNIENLHLYVRELLGCILNSTRLQLNTKIFSSYIFRVYRRPRWEEVFSHITDLQWCRLQDSSS